MGTGSFGGGSGSIGGGGSGSAGSGGSLLRAIEHLRNISARLKLDGDQARLTKEINDLLRDRGRTSSIKTLLSDGFADRLLGDLLEIGRRLNDGESWSDVATHFQVTTGAGSLQALCDARIEAALRAYDYDLDERSIERGSSAFRQFLATAVNGDLVLAQHGDAAGIEANVNRAYFNNTIGAFLGDLLAKVIVSDSVMPLGAATAAVETAADTIAIAIYDRFDQRFISKGKAQPRDAFRTIADNYAALAMGS